MISILFVNNNHDRASREMMVKDDRGNRYRLKIVDSQLVALGVNDRTIPTTDLGQYQTLLLQIDQALAEKQQQKQAHIDQTIARMKAGREQQLQQDKEAYRTKQVHLAKGEKKKLPAPPDIRYDQERVRAVIVANPADVNWFGLSIDELIVNGQRQSDALQQRLKALFSIKSNYGLYYGPVKMIGTGIFLDKEDMSR